MRPTIFALLSTHCWFGDAGALLGDKGFFANGELIRSHFRSSGVLIVELAGCGGIRRVAGAGGEMACHHRCCRHNGFDLHAHGRNEGLTQSSRASLADLRPGACGIARDPVAASVCASCCFSLWADERPDPSGVHGPLRTIAVYGTGLGAWSDDARLAFIGGYRPRCLNFQPGRMVVALAGGLPQQSDALLDPTPVERLASNSLGAGRLAPRVAQNFRGMNKCRAA